MDLGLRGRRALVIGASQGIGAAAARALAAEGARVALAARSAETLAVLKGAGFSDAVHVGGGVIAWANQVDPSLPTY